MLIDRNRIESEDGFTLIEMIVVMAILTIIVAAFVELLSLTITRSARTEEQATLQTEARAGIDALTSELRQSMCNGRRRRSRPRARRS